MRQISGLDLAINQFDSFIKTVLPPKERLSQRSSPAKECDKPSALSDDEIKHAAGLMRVNHTGEVCAQALYQGQAITAHSQTVKEKMNEAALEEVDHLAWCEERLSELDSHTSYFNPLWYGMSLSIGMLAGMVGDKWSLGFVCETERQVTRHLESHLESLPQTDARSRAIVEQMRLDEMQHATNALEYGGVELPKPIKTLMGMMSKVMTTLAYKV